MDKLEKLHSPWSSGPAEILKHGLELLENDTDSNRRLAMICIDNSVELMIKTYLGLPKRITGLDIKRNDYQGFSENFNNLLDALEEYAESRLSGINLGEIEWYHRLRNELYHQGNGLTVERDKVTVYAELANILFKNLFGTMLVEHSDTDIKAFGEFIYEWENLDDLLLVASREFNIDSNDQSIPPMERVNYLRQKGFFKKDEAEQIIKMRSLRNQVVHGNIKPYSDILPEMIEKVKEYSREIENRIKTRKTG